MKAIVVEEAGAATHQVLIHLSLGFWIAAIFVIGTPFHVAAVMRSVVVVPTTGTIPRVSVPETAPDVYDCAVETALIAPNPIAILYDF